MSADALRSEVISLIRSAVPEFDPSFSAVLHDEDGELGSFQAMSTFAGWILDRFSDDSEAGEVIRGFAVIERIASAEALPMARALVAEFVEAVAHDQQAVQYLGPESSRYM